MSSILPADATYGSYDCYDYFYALGCVRGKFLPLGYTGIHLATIVSVAKVRADSWSVYNLRSFAGVGEWLTAPSAF